MMKIFRIAALVPLSMSPLLSAAQGWSLEKCISYAEDNNIEIRRSQTGCLETRAALTESWLALLPRVAVEVNHSANWGRSVNLQDLTIVRNELTRTSTAAASASMYIFKGGTLIGNIVNRSIRHRMQQLECRALGDRIGIAITKAYLEVLLSGEMLRCTRDNLASVTRQRERTAVMVDVGSQPYSALLDMDSQLASERLKLAECENRLRSAELELRRLMDIPYSEVFEIDRPVLDSLPPYEPQDIEVLYAASSHLPGIANAEYALKSSRVALAVARGSAAPSISIGGTYGTYANHSSDRGWKDQARDNVNPAVGITLTIPILSGGATLHSIRSAALAVEDASLALQEERMKLLKEIQGAVADAEGFYHQCVAAEHNVRAMEESARITTDKFESGTVSSTDYIVARNNLSEALSNYYRAKWQYVFQLKIIDYYKGRKLTL